MLEKLGDGLFLWRRCLSSWTSSTNRPAPSDFRNPHGRRDVRVLAFLVEFVERLVRNTNPCLFGKALSPIPAWKRGGQEFPLAPGRHMESADQSVKAWDILKRRAPAGCPAEGARAAAAGRRDPSYALPASPMIALRSGSGWFAGARSAAPRSMASAILLPDAPASNGAGSPAARGNPDP